MLVYIVKKNNDFTEGRGPMLVDKIFANQADAHNYVNDQGSPYGDDPIKGGWYSINPIEVVQEYDPELVHKMREKIESLQAEKKEIEKELKALGNW